LLYKQGYNIIGIDLHPPTLQAPNPPATNQIPWLTQSQFQEQQQQQQQRGPSCVFLTVDLSNVSHIDSVPADLYSLGAEVVHVLVNNAGIADPYLPPLHDEASAAVQRADVWSKYIAGRWWVSTPTCGAAHVAGPCAL
jgi:NAD(P)-dependent dehydrogenase (short-subunit alcohol dehydrogenase family)